MKNQANSTVIRTGSAFRALFTGLALTVLLAGCAETQRQPRSFGSTHTYRSPQPPDAAARCFARNAEEHSSALTSEVTPRDERVEVVVRVKNGVTYATADFRHAGTGSVGSIALMVVSSGRQSDLLHSLTEGC